MTLPVLCNPNEKRQSSIARYLVLVVVLLLLLLLLFTALPALSFGHSEAIFTTSSLHIERLATEDSSTTKEYSLHSFHPHTFNLSITNDSCTEEYFRYGQWHRGAHICGLVKQYEDANIVDGNNVVPDDGREYIAGDYCWKPYGCQAEKFSRESFCKKLEGRKILIVGDSIQHQLYVSLHKLVNASFPAMDQWYSYPLDDPNLGQICEDLGGGRLYYLRNDQLSVEGNLSPWNLVQSMPRVTNRKWSSVAPHVDILILNKGAHYRSEDISTKMTRATAKFLQKYLKDNQRRHVFYRTTQQGAPHCSNTSVANTTLLLTEPTWLMGLNDSSPDDIDLYSTKYNWDKFPLINHKTVNILRSNLPADQFSVMHVAEMSALRPDGHRCPVAGQECDELHYYLPSVVDSWVYVFFNLLQPNNSHSSHHHNHTLGHHHHSVALSTSISTANQTNSTSLRRNL